MYLVRLMRLLNNLPSKAASEYPTIQIYHRDLDQLNARSSPLRRFWDQDEPPSSYYQETEGTPEYDRRRAVRCISSAVARLFTSLYSYLNAIQFARLK
jgi:hypothetical protein